MLWDMSAYSCNNYCNYCLCMFIFIKVPKYWTFRDHKVHSLASRHLQLVLIGFQWKQAGGKLAVAG